MPKGERDRSEASLPPPGHELAPGQDVHAAGAAAAGLAIGHIPAIIPVWVAISGDPKCIIFIRAEMRHAEYDSTGRVVKSVEEEFADGFGGGETVTR